MQSPNDHSDIQPPSNKCDNCYATVKLPFETLHFDVYLLSEDIIVIIAKCK